MVNTTTLTTEEQKKERQLIQRAYRNLLKSIPNMDETDQINVRKAYEIALQAHQTQRRKSGEPYILHPIEVARICAEEIGLGATAIVAALLHDVVEDTDITIEKIEEDFGPRIKHLVNGLTKLDKAYNVESPQAENFKKVIRTLTEDVRVVLIKMADRLHNMRTLGSMPKDKQLKIAAETSYIYAPLAHRLGLYSFKTEFQDLCMKITEPKLYKNIAKKINETKKVRNEYIERFIEPIEKALNDLNLNYRITGRPKSIYSIANKLKTKDVPFEEIYDLFAIRIIIDTSYKQEKPMCWLVYSSVTDIYNPIPERLKDWISNPKSNGYESLHTTVIGPEGRYVEVQIRTERMDEIAEKGFAAHWKYKGISPQPDVYDRWLNSVRDIIENPTTNAVEFVTDFKTNLFNEEVFVYTPKGDMKILPKGATALDFAFSIHSDIGYHCTVIKKDKQIVPMNYELKNGDQLEVITNKSQKPNEGWIKLVVTGKAKAKIRSAMKEERRQQGLLGREALERKFGHLKIDFNEENVEKLAKYYNYKSHIDLYFDLAKEKINATEILKPFQVEGGKLVEIPVKTEEPVEKTTVFKTKTTTPSKEDNTILINGAPADYAYTFATCCNPVQGDDIFAYFTATSGLKIHRTNCPNATNLMANYGYRIMKAQWGSKVNESFIAKLNITGVDAGVGIIERLTHELSSFLGINIRSFSIEGLEGFFEGKITLLVANTDQLSSAIERLQNLDIVSSVSRIE